MNTEDKIYNKIKSAAEKGATPDFSGMDKVWNRVEDKLDAQVSKSESSKWKKIAVAASIVVVGTIAYNFFDNKPEIITNKNSVVVNDSLLLNTNNTLVEASEESKIHQEETKFVNPNIVANADAILEKQIEEQPVVVTTIKKTNPVDVSVSEIKAEEIIMQDKAFESSDDYIQGNSLLPSAKKENSHGSSNYTITEAAVPNRAVQSKKENPLVVVDGEAKKGMKVEELINTEMDSVVYLKEPLYIINGKEYSEKELFGPNPTSPYAPLNQQDIISTTIYQGEDATKLYGEKGKKGVVIITTKNGKPKK
ncbi:hypothetical protein [Flavobacterium okayamense]|uniref:TonB-dependent outer membrane receptor, SusC/RagA subfamily, signature region n=1 Tax=Flavobacterium okayamense TaxID=2830782 RepID=A0ABN6HVY3_9FLAO|nr:hypothetical protein [Flavobacterium okayamense]BCY28522.1 hypothetical protein KK2020170_13900 [Flavobacterium okayamense]